MGDKIREIDICIIKAPRVLGLPYTGFLPPGYVEVSTSTTMGAFASDIKFDWNLNTLNDEHPDGLHRMLKEHKAVLTLYAAKIKG